MTPSEIEEAAIQVKAGLVATLGLTDVSILDSAAWYREQFSVSGNWDSWIWETVSGRDYGTRENHFAGFVVFGDRLGKASAGIVELALRTGRPVLVWNNSLRTVRSIKPVDASDMTSGWAIESASDIGS